MKLEEYIAVLQQKLAEVGNVEVAITQAGYYADGRFADLYDEPEVEVIELGNVSHWSKGVHSYTPSDKREFLVLGNSYQSY